MRCVRMKRTLRRDASVSGINEAITRHMCAMLTNRIGAPTESRHTLTCYLRATIFNTSVLDEDEQDEPLNLYGLLRYRVRDVPSAIGTPWIVVNWLRLWAVLAGR